jgi:hydroxyethylthiazole kinase-like sugar kinase family protein
VLQAVPPLTEAARTRLAAARAAARPMALDPVALAAERAALLAHPGALL